MALTLRDADPDELQRARQRGARKTHVNRPQCEIIYEALADRRLTPTQLADELGIGRGVVITTVNMLRRAGRVRICGTVSRHGKKGAEERVYEQGYDAAQVKPRRNSPIRRRLRPKNGSGEIAGKCYHRGLHWGGWGSLG